MSFGLRRKHELDPSGVGVALPPMPDDPGHARLDPRAWFREPHRPLEIEIGSGKGTFLLQQAQLDPATNYLGFEWAREFYEYAADRVRRAGLTNVRLVNADAGEFLRWRCPDAIVRVIHLYFPDPWPKTRHHKRRMVNDAFLEQCARVLVPGGELRVVTDHDEYWARMEEHFARWCGERRDEQTERQRDADAGPEESSTKVRIPDRSSPGTPDLRLGEGPGQPPGGAPALRAFFREPFERAASSRTGELVGTNFERKYRREGRPFHAAVLRKPAG